MCFVIQLHVPKRCTSWTGEKAVWHNFLISHGGLHITSKTLKSYVIQKYPFWCINQWDCECSCLLSDKKWCMNNEHQWYILCTTHISCSTLSTAHIHHDILLLTPMHCTLVTWMMYYVVMLSKKKEILHPWRSTYLLMLILKIKISAITWKYWVNSPILQRAHPHGVDSGEEQNVHCIMGKC